MEKKFDVSEQNFTEGKALHYSCSVMQCAKLSLMIKNLAWSRKFIPKLFVWHSSRDIVFWQFRLKKNNPIFFLLQILHLSEQAYHLWEHLDV